MIAADCTAYAYAAFHRDFIKNHITLVGCPKLDEGDYTEKLTAIISQNNIKSLTIVRMEVPCCGDLKRAATGPGLIANHIADKASKVVATDFSRGKTIFAMILGEIRKC